MNNQTRNSAGHAGWPLFLTLFLGLAAPAHAYVDPGTGSMMLQMAIAGIAGAMFYFRQLRFAIVAWVRRVVLRQAPPPAAVDADRVAGGDAG
jgi:hypothetical protein